ncbi:MAG TPA: hypothetical protein VGM03_00780 [Phycisphaerae bacterium]|jgi:hypothetical protein
MGIWNRIIRPERGDLSPEAAQCLLELNFDPANLQRMHELAIKHQANGLADEERAELSEYRLVGLQLDFLHSKARLSLQRAVGSR